MCFFKLVNKNLPWVPFYNDFGHLELYLPKSVTGMVMVLLC